MDKPIIVTFGRYVYPEPYHRIHLEITETFDKAEISREDATTQLVKFVTGVLEEELFRYKPINGPPKTEHTPPTSRKKVSTPPQEAPAKDQKQIPYKFPHLDQAPWKSYQTKQPCTPGEAGWIFSDTPNMESLVDLITRDGEVLVTIGDVTFVLAFSGPRDNPTRFIKRNLPKENGDRRR